MVSEAKKVKIARMGLVVSDEFDNFFLFIFSIE